jgi:hypothetical protein
VLNAKVASSLDGPVDYWFRYGERGDQANWSDTPHQTVEVTEGETTPVSGELTGLQPSHRYGWQVCVADRQEDPPRVVCSTEREFGTVGDLVVGGHTDFNARSGPGGENPAGDVGGQAVTCLRVQGGGRATVGVESGVYYLDLIENSSPEVYYIVFAPWLDGSNRSDCTQPTSGDTTGFLDIRLWVYDAP